MRSSVKGVAPEWYTLTVEREQPDPVSFKIHPLDSFGWFDVLAESYDPVSGEIGGAGIKQAFKTAVRGWKNIEDADNPGEQLKYSKAAMGALPVGWIMEVGQYILAISQVSGATSKNSDSLSLSPET